MRDANNQPKLSKWAQRIHAGKSLVAKYKDEWERNKMLLSGEKRYYEYQKDDLTYYFNMYRSYITTLRARLVPTDVNFSITRYGVDDDVETAVLNGFAEQKIKAGLLKSIPLVFNDAVRAAYGILHVDFEEIKRTGFIETQEQQEAQPDEGPDVLDELIAEAEETTKKRKPGRPPKIEKVESEEPSGENVLTEYNFNLIYESVDPADFVFDTHCQKLTKDPQWVAHKKYLTREQFLNTEKFDHKDAVIAAMSDDGKGDLDVGEIEEDSEYGRVEIWEIWDVASRKKIYVPNNPDVDVILCEEDYPIDNPDFKFPYVFLNLQDDDTHDIIPKIPIMSFIHSMHDQYNRMRSTETSNVSAKVQQWWTLGDLIDPIEEEKLKSPLKNSIIKVNPIEGIENPRIGDLIKPVSENPIPLDCELQINRTIKDAQDSIGQAESERGGIPITKTATEAQQVSQAISIVAHSNTQRILNAFTEATKMSLIIAAEMMDESIWVNISDQAKPSWVTISAEVLQGAFFVEVMPGTKNMSDRNQKYSMYLSLLKIISEMANAGMPVTPDPLVRHILRLSELPPVEIDQIMGGVKRAAYDVAKMLAVLSMQQDQVQEADMQAWMGKVSILISKVLSQREIAAIRNEIQGNTGSEAKMNVNAIRSASTKAGGTGNA